MSLASDLYALLPGATVFPEGERAQPYERDESGLGRYPPQAVVLPGSGDTDMLKKTAFPPQIQPGEVAQVVRFLAADAPFAMTGSAVEVFG